MKPSIKWELFERPRMVLSRPLSVPNLTVSSELSLSGHYSEGMGWSPGCCQAADPHINPLSTYSAGALPASVTLYPPVCSFLLPQNLISG